MNSSAPSIPKNDIVFKFPLKAVSFQQSRYGKGFVYKTDYQKHFLAKVEFTLIRHKVLLENFGKKFDPKTHILVGQWFFLYKNFFTQKENTVSSANPDLENGKKMIQDAIFLRLGLNDKDICHSDDVKWKGEDSIIFKLKLVERDDFEKYMERKLKEVLS